MATFDLPILTATIALDTDVFPSLVSDQIVAAAAPSIGNQICYVMEAVGGDEGLYASFRIPQNYVGTPLIVVRGVLDGAPGASQTLGFGFRKRAVADNEVADGTYDAEQTASATIGSSGSNHGNEDEYEETITLTAGDYAVGDTVYFYFFIDDSGTDYAGNFLLTGLFFRYDDA